MSGVEYGRGGGRVGWGGMIEYSVVEWGKGRGG